MDDFPKVLVSCPTAEVKNYCFHDWLENVMCFTYPNYDVIMFDNTPDKGKNAKYLNKVYANKYGYSKNRKFKVINSVVNAKVGVIERMAVSHNDCRNYALREGYDYLLHLESDVFPPKDVIERLLFQGKKFVNALYYTDEGKSRRPMVQTQLQIATNYGSSYWLNHKDEPMYLNGELLKVASAGLGCALIDVSVLKKIGFRWEKNVNKHPDTFFAEDCQKNNIPVFCDTSIVCEHRNKEWGIFGIDYK